MTENKPVVRLLQGNEACAEGAIAAGCRFYAGYPITPSTEIAEIMSSRLPQEGGKFIQMEDEIASIAAIIGASMAGVKSCTATSGPGYSLMMENIGYACVSEIPVVIINVQRCGPSTGQPTATGQGDLMQAKWGTHSDHPAVAVAPASAQEMYDLTAKAFSYSEKYRVPVTVLSDAVVGHIREKVVMRTAAELQIAERKVADEDTPDYRPMVTDESLIPALANLGSKLHPYYTGLVHGERGFFTSKAEEISAFTTRLTRKIEIHAHEMEDYEEWGLDDCEVCLVSFGVSGRAALNVAQGMRKEGKKVGHIRLRTVWPFPEKRIRDIADYAKAFVVPEMNLGQLKLEVERSVCGKAAVYGVNNVTGSLLTTAEIYECIRKVI
ncbi:MAG: 2-oxoacid:acceptor oxidoreductase subunit alpha [bacterium]|jgi:2-oxoglutarate ferredoxin oxidoreductase subunit alpha